MSFAAAPHSIVVGQEPRLDAKHARPPIADAVSEEGFAPARDSAPARRDNAKKAVWTFEGTAFDLLTTRGIFGVQLTLVDAAGNVVGRTNSGPAGRYRMKVPAGTGYKLKLSHGDYSGRYLDESGGADSLRQATLRERRLLMTAVASNLPWTGDSKKPVRRDLALVPRSPEEP